MLTSHCLKLDGEYQGHNFSTLNAAVRAAMELTGGSFDLASGIGRTPSGQEVRVYGHPEEPLSDISVLNTETEGGRAYERYFCPHDVDPFRVPVGSPGSLSLSNIGMID